MAFCNGILIISIAGIMYNKFRKNRYGLYPFAKIKSPQPNLSKEAIEPYLIRLCS